MLDKNFKNLIISNIYGHLQGETKPFDYFLRIYIHIVEIIISYYMSLETSASMFLITKIMERRKNS